MLCPSIAISFRRGEEASRFPLHGVVPHDPMMTVFVHVHHLGWGERGYGTR
jgi:hypothetical protein